MVTESGEVLSSENSTSPNQGVELKSKRTKPVPRAITISARDTLHVTDVKVLRVSLIHFQIDAML